jgi:hypothetical protein
MASLPLWFSLWQWYPTTDKFQNYPVLIWKNSIFSMTWLGILSCALPSSHLLRFFESVRHISEAYATSQKSGADNKVSKPYGLTQNYSQQQNPSNFQLLCIEGHAEISFIVITRNCMFLIKNDLLVHTVHLYSIPHFSRLLLSLIQWYKLCN